MADAVPRFRQTLSPLGRDVAPAGEDDFEDLVNAYKAMLEPGCGPVHIAGMVNMAECRGAILACRETGNFPVWVSWVCGEDGESPADVQMLAALFVCEGMGAAAFGVACSREIAGEWLDRLSHYASVPLYAAGDDGAVLFPYQPRVHDPDVIPCAAGGEPCFVTRTVDVGEDVECSPDLLERIIEAEDDPVGAMKIAVYDEDDLDIFARDQFAVQKALCLTSDVPELLEGALRVFQGRAFYDGTDDLEDGELERLRETYGLIIL